MTSAQMATEALSRAQGSNALTNLPTIYREFMARGIPEDAIQPRVNVLTFHAWHALGRHVRRGEHGVKITTWIPFEEKKDVNGTVTRRAGRAARTAVVFHVSQTDPDSTPQVSLESRGFAE